MNLKQMALLLMAVVTAACGPTPTPTPRPPVLPTAAPTATVQPAPPAIPQDAAEVVRLALADVANRAAVKTEDITIVSVEAVDWPTSALGCPQPGMMYLQVITPGYKITLSVGRQTYTYHSDKKRIVYCPQSR